MYAFSGGDAIVVITFLIGLFGLIGIGMFWNRKGERGTINGLLASIVGFLNGFIALLFIICGALVGQSLNFQLDGMGLVLGLIIGVILAIVVCGLLAIFVSMLNELRAIRRLLEKQSQ